MQGLVPDLKKFIQGKLFSDSFFTLLSHLGKSLHRRINAILISIGHFGFFLVIFNHHKHFWNVFLVTAPFYISRLFSFCTHNVCFAFNDAIYHIYTYDIRHRHTHTRSDTPIYNTNTYTAVQGLDTWNVHGVGSREKWFKITNRLNDLQAESVFLQQTQNICTQTYFSIIFSHILSLLNKTKRRSHIKTII